MCKNDRSWGVVGRVSGQGRSARRASLPCMTLKNKTAAISDDRGRFVWSGLYLNGSSRSPSAASSAAPFLVTISFREAMPALLGRNRKTKARQKSVRLQTNQSCLRLCLLPLAMSLAMAPPAAPPRPAPTVEPVVPPSLPPISEPPADPRPPPSAAEVL